MIRVPLNANYASSNGISPHSLWQCPDIFSSGALSNVLVGVEILGVQAFLVSGLLSFYLLLSAPVQNYCYVVKEHKVSFLVHPLVDNKVEYTDD